MATIPVSIGGVISFVYTNYKGITEDRKAVVRGLRYGSNEFHPKEQMFIDCFCLDRHSYRSFAIADISELKVLG